MEMGKGTYSLDELRSRIDVLERDLRNRANHTEQSRREGENPNGDVDLRRLQRGVRNLAFALEQQRTIIQDELGELRERLEALEVADVTPGRTGADQADA